MPLDNVSTIENIINASPVVLPRLQPLNIADFLALDLPPRGMVLAPWLPEKGLAMVVAPRGIGKTFFALTAKEYGLSKSQVERLKKTAESRGLLNQPARAEQ